MVQKQIVGPYWTKVGPIVGQIPDELTATLRKRDMP